MFCSTIFRIVTNIPVTWYLQRKPYDITIVLPLRTLIDNHTEERLYFRRDLPIQRNWIVNVKNVIKKTYL